VNRLPPGGATPLRLIPSTGGARSPVSSPVAQTLGWMSATPFSRRALRGIKEYNPKVEYIDLNPVRAGLVSRPEDGRWSSYSDQAGLSADESVSPSVAGSVDRRTV